MAVRVNSIDAVIWSRARTNVGEKAGKRMTPLLTHSNAAATVAMEVFAATPFAPADHPLPGSVFWESPTTMPDRACPRFFNPKATARVNIAVNQTSVPNKALSITIATTPPHRLALVGLASERHYNEASEALPIQAHAWHESIYARDLDQHLISLLPIQPSLALLRFRQQNFDLAWMLHGFPFRSVPQTVVPTGTRELPFAVQAQVAFGVDRGEEVRHGRKFSNVTHSHTSKIWQGRGWVRSSLRNSRKVAMTSAASRTPIAPPNQVQRVIADSAGLCIVRNYRTLRDIYYAT